MVRALAVSDPLSPMDARTLGVLLPWCFLWRLRERKGTKGRDMKGQEVGLPISHSPYWAGILWELGTYPLGAGPFSQIKQKVGSATNSLSAHWIQTISLPSVSLFALILERTWMNEYVECLGRIAWISNSALTVKEKWKHMQMKNPWPNHAVVMCRVDYFWYTSIWVFGEKETNRVLKYIRHWTRVLFLIKLGIFISL